MLLILANKWDLTVDLVVLELRRRKIPFVRLNTEDLTKWSASARFPSSSMQLRFESKEVNVSDLSAVWNRRPGRVFEDLPPEEKPTAATQEFVANQWFSWLEGLQLQEHLRWVNHPIANSVMENKLRQLELAVRMGFAVPDTLVTNCSEDVRSWAV